VGKVHFTRGIAASAAIVAAVAGGASAAALATSQSSSKSFQACLSSKGRTLYDVRFNPASPVTCHRGDTRVQWSQTGPAGQPGQPGQTGPAGQPGQPGQPAQGGQPGQPGADGKTILNGTGAPAAGLGTNGDFYIDTSANTIYGPKTDSGWGGPTALTGPNGNPGQPGTPGQPGADGKTILNGTGAPAAGLGANGDFYIDTTANAIYGPRTHGAWGGPTSLVGPKGNQGSPGLSGFATVTGTTGTVPTGNVGAIDVPCPGGETAISGGYTIPFTATVLEDHPVAGSPGVWHVAAAFPSASGTITAYAQCANVQ
jgi:hypothetical protein